MERISLRPICQICMASAINGISIGPDIIAVDFKSVELIFKAERASTTISGIAVPCCFIIVPVKSLLIMINDVFVRVAPIIQIVRTRGSCKASLERLNRSSCAGLLLVPLPTGRPGVAVLIVRLSVETGKGHHVRAVVILASGITCSGVRILHTINYIDPVCRCYRFCSTGQLTVCRLSPPVCTSQCIIGCIGTGRKVGPIILCSRIDIMMDRKPLGFPCIESPGILCILIPIIIICIIHSGGRRSGLPRQLHIRAIAHNAILSPAVARGWRINIRSRRPFRLMSVLIIEVHRHQIAVIEHVDDCAAVRVDRLGSLACSAEMETGVVSAGFALICIRCGNFRVGRTIPGKALRVIVGLLGICGILTVRDFLAPDDHGILRVRIRLPLSEQRLLCCQGQPGGRIRHLSGAVRHLVPIGNDIVFDAAFEPAEEAVSGSGRHGKLSQLVVAADKLRRHIGRMASGLTGNETQPVGFDKDRIEIRVLFQIDRCGNQNILFIIDRILRIPVCPRIEDMSHVRLRSNDVADQDIAVFIRDLSGLDHVLFRVLHIFMESRIDHIVIIRL